jgi:CHAT domain-containing protein
VVDSLAIQALCFDSSSRLSSKQPFNKPVSARLKGGAIMRLHAKPRWSWIIAAAVYLAALSFAQDKSAAPQAEEAALRAVVEKFFAAYDKKDVEEMMALWSEKSPDFASHKQAMQQRFAVEDYSFANITVTRIKVEGQKASLRVAIDIAVANQQTKQRHEERMMHNFSLVKSEGEWGVWRYTSAADDLAEALVEVKSEEERAQLLAAEREMLTPALTRALIAQGNRSYSRGNYPLAATIYHLAHSIGERIGDQAGIAYTLGSIGNVYNSLNSYAQALEHYQKSLVMLEALGNKTRIAITLGNIGVVYRRQGNLVQALEYYQKSLAMSEATGDQEGIARNLYNTGNILDQQGNYEQAREYYQKSLALSESIGLKYGIALSLGGIGTTYNNQDNYLRALEYYQRGLEMLETLGSKSAIADILGNIGIIFHQQGNYLQALKHYQKSLAIREDIGDKAGIAFDLNGIGGIHYGQGNYAQSLDYYQKSLKMSEAIGYKTEVATTLRLIGDVYYQQAKYVQALEHYQKSLIMQESLSEKKGTALALNSIGNVYVKQGRYAEALLVTNRAVALAHQSQNIETLWQAHLIIGQAYYALNQPTHARQAFEGAVAAIESLRTQVAGGEHEQQRFFEGRLSPYLAMVDLLISREQTSEALTYAERTKARVLLDVLHNGRISVSKALTTREQEQERKLNNQLVSLNTQLYREKQRKEPDKTRLAELEAQLQKGRLEYEAFQTNLYAVHPDLKTQRGEAQTISLKQAAELLPDAKTALLEFVVTEDKTLLFALTKSAGAQNPIAIKAFPITIKQKDLAKLTEQFRRQLAQPASPVNKMARELFDLLFKDAQPLISGKDKLIIVLDGPLWEMPFQALLSPRNRYLLQDYAIAYAPSLTVLREMIKLRQRKSSEVPTLLAVGNPALGTDVVERRKVLMDDPLDPLPDAEKQVQSLSKFYGPRRSRIYVGAAATEERVKAEAGQHAILHLATHGILNDRSPMYSHLVLAQNYEKERKEDGLLEAWEILNLDLKADLAVLSACETARGRIGAGEGMIGLTWALFVAGVPTTVVSQWKVRSDSTAELMVEFHRLLQARDAKGAPHVTRAEALRRAALKLLNNSQYRHPFHWAGFVLVGDWR